MLLNDRQITELCHGPNGMIYPFNARQVTTIPSGAVAGTTPTVKSLAKAISSGLSSVGYDITIGPKIKFFRPQTYFEGKRLVIDPKNFDPDLLMEHTVVDTVAPNNYFEIPAHGYCLANTPEYFRMPEDVAAICLTKSTYARCGLIVNVTPLEPDWDGHLTLELANVTELPIKVYVNEGIAQLLFFRLGSRPAVTYRDRGGKYQGQGPEPVIPRMK